MTTDEKSVSVNPSFSRLDEHETWQLQVCSKSESGIYSVSDTACNSHVQGAAIPNLVATTSNSNTK